MDKNFPQKVIDDTQTEFTVDEFGLYAISITVSCENGHDLKVEIDEKLFREIPAAENVQTYNIPPAWNSAEIRGLKKTVVFLLKLNRGKHTVKFFPKTEATAEDFNYEIISDYRKIDFNLEQQAQDGDRRPWITFVLSDLPLESVTAESSVSWHWFDGDDVKLIIDNETQESSVSKRWKYWAWHASPLWIFSGSKREQKTFSKNLPQGIHYIEFWADRTPTLHQVSLNLGKFELKRTPSKDDPEWTGDFADDTDIMLLARLIFGEARNQSKEAMLGVGWTIKNRVNAKRSYFGSNYHEVILKNDKGVYQFSSLNPNEKENFPLLIDPFRNKGDERTHEGWLNAYDVSESIINGTNDDPTDGATFFHSEDLSQETFTTKSVPGAIFIKKIGAFLFYKDPNEQ
ncbi:MAG: hypothetical protein A2288_01090 [Candidatus Moranbacteria bacterium RIFOXYA12_FULL_44_15]|nr:MAG: hypothetical protein A2288_01090 [Candidatus Moranbacteria bacterium RIFOXYA12_FULL_44_15]